jgi:hypothetical protein
LGSSMMGFLIKLSIKNALLKRKKNTWSDSFYGRLKF